MMLLYDVGYRVFFFAKCIRTVFPKFEKLARTYEEYFTLFLNRKMAPWFDKNPVGWGLNTKKRKERYIVSLTSFPTRINYVHIAIETLMRQSFKPDQIVLWLAEEQFPDKMLPERLTRLQDKGLTIRFCDDLRSHKKYYYAFQEYSQDNVILADDDLFYARDTLKQLARLHKKYPDDICAVSAQIIEPNFAAAPTQWPAAKPAKKYVSSSKAQAFTGAGSLFPAMWYPEECFDKEQIMIVAETADDLWLKAMSLVAGVRTSVICPVRGFPAEISIANNQTLFAQNGPKGENKNNLVWESLVRKYHLDQYTDEGK